MKRDPTKPTHPIHARTASRIPENIQDAVLFLAEEIDTEHLSNFERAWINKARLQAFNGTATYDTLEAMLEMGRRHNSHES